MDLSVIIPAFNEEKRLPATLRRVISYLSSTRAEWEVIVVDDGSRDGTARLVKDMSASGGKLRLVANLRNMGKGYSIRNGVLAADGRLILTTDADLSAPIEEMQILEEAIAAGAAVAIGSRAITGARLERRQPIYRECLGKMFNLFIRMVILPEFLDTQCGFKMFIREAAKEIYSKCRLNGFATDVEALAIARQLGYSIVEVPVRWSHANGSAIRPIADGLRMCKDVLDISRRIRSEIRPGEGSSPEKRNRRGRI
ncbi:MAG: glycosyltransferase family 2 protein [Firmicutes bacterium]|nr:glycosyltransferase family 2 protein [Bacillota bacterium]